MNNRRKIASSLDHVLYQAVNKEEYDVVESLLESGASPNGYLDPDTKDSCLHIAIYKEDDDLIELLVEYGADLTALNNEGFTPIQAACDVENIDAVTQIANLRTTDFDDKARYSQALIRMVSSGERDAAIALLKAGASPNKFFEKETRESCLQLAVRNDDLRLIEALLVFGASITHKNISGKRALDIAGELEHWDCVKVLSSDQCRLTGASILKRLLNGEAKAVTADITGLTKEAVFAAILRLFPDVEDKQKTLADALNQEHVLGQFFMLARGFFVPSKERGLYKRISDEYEQVTFKISLNKILSDRVKNEMAALPIIDMSYIGAKSLQEVFPQPSAPPILTNAAAATIYSDQSQVYAPDLYAASAQRMGLFAAPVPVAQYYPNSYMASSLQDGRTEAAISAPTEVVSASSLTPVYKPLNKNDMTLTAQLADLPRVVDLPPLPEKSKQEERRRVYGF